MATLTAHPRDDRTSLGIILMLSAWAFFALTDTTVKWLVMAGIPAMQLAFFRYAVAFGLSLGNGLRHGQFFVGLDRRDLLLVTLRGSLLVLATVLNFKKQISRAWTKKKRPSWRKTISCQQTSEI